MNLFFVQELTEKDHLISFSKEESRHIAKSLRHKKGDTLYITNGKGFLFTSSLVEVSDKVCTAKIIQKEKKGPLPYQLHMAVAPTKNIDRFEWFLEKATEIGISEITPLLCDHSERKVIKTDRLEKIIESAMKQSLKMYKPILHDLTPFSEFVTQQSLSEKGKFIAHCEVGEKQLLKNLLSPKDDSLILIGPEGDFSYKEIDVAQKNNFVPITLGESRLRTETAAIAACHSIFHLNLQ
ncbi:MAG: 16S rRNA (uracil(1498)-N(3))-methyltransferase [Flavobacteriaceae bacterium]